MGEFMFLSTGDPEKDAELAQQIRRHDHLEAEGMCPNGCAPMVWDDPHNGHCPRCHFFHHSSKPYGGGPVQQREERRPWCDRLMDRLAFAIVWLAALIDHRVWIKERGEIRTYRAGAWRSNPSLTPGRLLPGLPWFHWQMRHGVPLENYWQHDGWRPGRYV